MTYAEERVTLVSSGGVRITFDPSECCTWEIYEAQTGSKIGFIAVDDDGMVVGADIQQKYQRKGIATAVVRYLVEECQRMFYFWRPDGQRYDDARHLSVEGAELANSLIAGGLASWVDNEPRSECRDD